MRRLLLLCSVLPLTAVASEHWVRFTSGPVEIYGSVGSKDGRETLVTFEEFRHALGYMLGDNDVQMSLPIRILLFKTGAPQVREPVLRGRGQYNVVLTAGQPLSNEMFSRLTQLFLGASTARLPERLERGLIALFSTIQVSGSRITLGEPPLHPDLDWARVHLMAVDPAYYGNLRVLTYNLRRGVDEDAAFRSAFGKTPDQVELEAQSHLAAGRFRAISIAPLAMSPEDFSERSVDSEEAKLALADLLLGDESRAIYGELIAQKTRVAEAWEGLGMLALREGQPDEARQDFAAAVKAGAKSAACYVGYARLLPDNAADNAKALAVLDMATKIDPKLAEPHFLMAQRQTEPLKRIQEVKLAADLDARNIAYWQALAEAYLEVHDFVQAAQALKSAEQAVSTPADRALIQSKRLEVDVQRLDWRDAENRRNADEEAREIERLAVQARADEKAVAGDGSLPSGVAIGVLKQVDCLGKRVRLVLQDDGHKTVKLLIPDSTQVTVVGHKKLELSCGEQYPRRVKVEYFPKANAKLATKGEVAAIEFQ
jgi:tetratricopeptide (TPR) repeat protein